MGNNNEELDDNIETVADDANEPGVGNEDPNKEVLDEGANTEEPAEPAQRMFTQSQLEAAIKNRLNSTNKKLEKAKVYQAAVESMSAVTGMTPEQLTARLSTLSVQEQAKLLNVTPEQVEQRNKLTKAQKAMAEETQKLERDLEKQRLLSDPSCKDFALYETEVFDILEDSPKLTLRQAYILAKGDQTNESAIRDAEQRAVARMTKSSNQRSIKPGQAAPASSVKLDPGTLAAAKRVGMDPIEYAAYAGMSNLDDYEAYAGKQKKG